MGAKNRTFSYAFLVENLWFQILIAMSIFSVHPLADTVLPHSMQIAIVYFMFIYREFVPKTSYASWEVGNNKVNSRSDGWVRFINIQVKLVRWNFVLKKGLLFYLFVMPYLVGVLIETAINLKLIYPSKLSYPWKNRCQVIAKGVTVLAATSYLYLTL